MILRKDTPYITLDEHVNVKGLLDLEDEFNFMVSSENKHTIDGVWVAGNHNPEHKNAFYREKDALYYVHHRAKLLRKTDKQLDKYISHFEKTNDINGLAKFYKLKFHAYDPFTIMKLRYVINNEENKQTYKWNTCINNFPNIKKFFEELPFTDLQTITLFYVDHYVPIGYHADINYFPYDKDTRKEREIKAQEFIWMRFNLNRDFYVYDIEDGKILESYPFKGYCVYFNDHNWHGNFNPIPFSSITIKAEGNFIDELKKYNLHKNI